MCVEICVINGRIGQCEPASVNALSILKLEILAIDAANCLPFSYRLHGRSYASCM